MKKLSEFVENINESATLASSKRAKELKTQGRDIIDLTLGQPDFVTPSAIGQAAIQSIESGKASFYTASGGISELKNAISDYWLRFYGYKPIASEIFVGTGAKFALYAYFLSVLDKDDEVIIPAPYWVSYLDQVKMASGKPVIVKAKADNAFKVTIDQLEAVKSDKSKVLLLNSPANPTGVVYTENELQEIGNWAIDNDLLILSDDIYHRLVFGKAKFSSISSLSDELRQRTMVINGASKSFSMTGWRIGLAVGDPEIIAAMTKIASQTISNTTAVSQYAAVEAFSSLDDRPFEEMHGEFEHRLNVCSSLIQEIPGFELVKPDGAFYIFPDVSKAMSLMNFSTVDQFVRALLEEAGVATVSGRSFGSENHLRISIATDLESLVEGISRIKNWMEKNAVK